MLLSWLTYLRVNHAELYQQYQSSIATAQTYRDGSAFGRMLKVDQEWAAKVNEMLTTKEPQRATG